MSYHIVKFDLNKSLLLLLNLLTSKSISMSKLCGPSKNWLGRYSSISKINSGKLWLIQHLNSIGMTDSDKRYLLEEVTRTKAK